MKNGDYLVAIGDVARATQSQAAVIATAYAYGGDINNLEPGFEYWREMAKNGRIDKGTCDLSRLESGEAQVAILWDYNCLNDHNKYWNQILILLSSAMCLQMALCRLDIQQLSISMPLILMQQRLQENIFSVMRDRLIWQKAMQHQSARLNFRTN